MIKVLALDVYGTILTTHNPDNEMPPRRGFDALVSACQVREIPIVTASDAIIINQKHDLKESGLSLALFTDFYQLGQPPAQFKDFGWILQAFSLQPQELLVVGDSEAKDIAGARACGAQFYKIQPYNYYKDYQTIEDFGEVIKLLGD